MIIWRNVSVFSLLAATLILGGCVRTTTAVAGAMSDAAVKTVATGATVTGDVINASIPDADTNHGSEHHGNDDPRPFDANRNAMQDVDIALKAAEYTRNNVLLVLGANWCHDSRGLAAKFQQPELDRLVSESYELVWVDVGRRDRNLDVARRFGVGQLIGTPTVIITSPNGHVLNSESVHDWRTADSISYEDTLAYFAKFAEKTAPSR